MRGSRSPNPDRMSNGRESVGRPTVVAPKIAGAAGGLEQPDQRARRTLLFVLVMRTATGPVKRSDSGWTMMAAAPCASSVDSASLTAPAELISARGNESVRPASASLRESGPKKKPASVGFSTSQHAARSEASVTPGQLRRSITRPEGLPSQNLLERLVHITGIQEGLDLEGCNAGAVGRSLRGR
jgi:hypothetical protein